MNKTPVIIVLVPVLLMVLTGLLQAEDFTVGVNYTGYYSDNIFNNASAVTDYVSRLNADIIYSIKKFNFFLDTSAGLFTDNSEFNSFRLEPGIEFFHSIKGRNGIFLRMGYRVLKNEELYTDFNYTGPRFQAGVKIYTSSQSFLKAGYSVEIRNYSNYPSFDFHNHSIYTEWNRFFESQTTVRMQAGFNYRYYPHIADEYDFGKGYNYYENRGHSGEGRQSGIDGNYGPGIDQSAQGYSSHTLSVPNIYGLLRITQGMGTRVGLTGEAEVRWNFSGLDNAETLIRNAYIIYPYNDDYLWDGSRFSLIMKTVLFKGFSLEGLVSYFNKKYPGINILDAEGRVIEPTEERKDSFLFCRLKLSQKFGKLDISALVSYGDNDSNDSFFQYNMFTVSAGIGYFF